MKTLVMGLAVMGLAARGAEGLGWWDVGMEVWGKTRIELGREPGDDTPVQRGDFEIHTRPDGPVYKLVWASTTGRTPAELMALVREDFPIDIPGAPAEATDEYQVWMISQGPFRRINLRMSGPSAKVFDADLLMRETRPAGPLIPKGAGEITIKATRWYGLDAREVAKGMNQPYPGPLGEIPSNGYIIHVGRDGVVSGVSMKLGQHYNAGTMIAYVAEATGQTIPTAPDIRTDTRMAWVLSQGKVAAIEVSGLGGEYNLVQWTFRY